ncbi:DUF3151 domain-containing protein [Micromonospora olivasterospora]|uniref:Uncharacterized protein DUF3151 n=1 Tax=Micromonospora olivasterospora TaxID=1880 RepID=A0A562IA20_MICOL|nr:DUF3151 domain-containing protein [Micromonospora olivasterospora]TWH67638.1 uncharacterized protein DUF3151 [Micromonospora olivasterospora]
MQNLLPEPPATHLPDHADADAALAAAEAGGDQAYEAVAARFPTYSAAWGALASRALAAGQVVPAYAYARTGYHRGLDQLRRTGWKGHGPVPWSHAPNQGFLRCLYVLSRAAGEIGEADEAARCAQFLRDCDPAAADALASN